MNTQFQSIESPRKFSVDAGWCPKNKTMDNGQRRMPCVETATQSEKVMRRPTASTYVLCLHSQPTLAIMLGSSMWVQSERVNNAETWQKQSIEHCVKICSFYLQKFENVKFQNAALCICIFNQRILLSH